LAESYIGCAPDGAGKKMRTKQVNLFGNDVEQEVVVLAKADGTIIEDFATETTLALVATEATQETVHDHVHSIDSKITACNTGAVTIAGSALPGGAATEATLGTVHGHVESIDTKITKCDTDNVGLKAGTAAIGTVIVTDVNKTVAPTYVQATLANTTEVYTVGAGKKTRVKLIDVWNSGAANITVDLRMAVGGSPKFKKTLAANTGFIVNLQHCNWEGAADEDLFINLSGAGTVNVTVMCEDIT
jgi:hypothetical protein